MSQSETNRIRCLTEGCSNTIQPATAARTGGYCGPCAGRRDLEAREAYIRANRREVDRYAGVVDRVEMLVLMHTPPKHDPLVHLVPPPHSIEEVYADLSADDADRLMQVITENIRRGDDVAEDMARCLAAFTDYELDPMLEVWLDHRDPYPAIIFRKAGSRIRDRIMRSLTKFFSVLRADHALSALAVIGDDAVVRFLCDAQSTKPRWARKLHIGPADYARTAGWEIVDGGRRRELTFSQCVAVKLAEGEDDRTSKQMQVMQSATSSCPWCQGRLANLIAAESTGPPLVDFRDVGQRIEVLTCPVCTCYGIIHATLDERGHGHWAEGNTRPAYLPSPTESARWDASPWTSATIRLTPRRAFHAADQFLPTTFSQIGGMPAWVQDPEYPRCLLCDQTMKFLAQIDNAAFPLHEGFYYAFICTTCRTTATIYQQT